jgi:TPR repeat protein
VDPLGDLPLPKEIGPYVVQGLLGAGGVGEVYKALDPRSGEPVAVKVLRIGRGADERQRRRFAREQRALAQLRHPGIVQVLSAGEDHGAPWLVLHRDLKPENVLLAAGGQAVITDFGLAKELETEESLRLSKTGLLQGTPRYWAPEQAAGQGGEATEATDIYGLGATLYAALTGAPPVEGSSWVEVLVATRDRPPRPPSELSPGVPDWLEAVVLRCLEKAPADRFTSLADLDAALSSGGAQSSDDNGGTPQPRSPLSLVVGGALGVVGVLLVAFAVASSTSGVDSGRAVEPESQAMSAPSHDSTPEPEGMEVAPPGVSAPDPHSAERAEELFELARGFERQGRDAEVVAALREAGELGHAHAMNNLGVCLEVGRGVPQDVAEAVRWYRRAAELEHAAAMSNLANCLARGWGVLRKEAEAVRWYRRAAELGDPAGMFNLGNCLANGLGLPRDEAEAVRWFRRAADLGDAQAMYNLGVCLEVGRGLPRDGAEAAVWYRRAAELGNAKAMSNLGGILLNGRGVAQDEAEAARWYRLAAERGHAAAMYNLGVCLLNGRGVAQDEAEALRWIRLAAASSDPQIVQTAEEALRSLQSRGQ